MRVAFFTNTPAHVHLYKHAVRALEAAGHEVLVLGRDYGCTTDLLEFYDLTHQIYGRLDTTTSSVFTRLPYHYFRVFRAVRRFDPDLLFGMGGYAAHAGLVSRTPVVLVLDSEPTTLDHLVSSPFARSILTPDSFRKDLGSHHHVFHGFKETAYLHPDVYEPVTDPWSALGVAQGEPYTLVRLNAFGSHHDIGEFGFSTTQRRDLIHALAEQTTVFVSDEGGEVDLSSLPSNVRPFDTHPAYMHDILSEAALLVADTQTMVTEAALLGTPAVRSNSFVAKEDMGNFLELERRDLVRNLAEFDAVLDTAVELLERPGVKETWRRRSREYLAEQVDLTDLIVSVAERHGRVDGLEELSPR